MIQFDMDMSVLRAAAVFTKPDHYIMNGIRLRRAAGVFEIEATNSAALVFMRPPVGFTNDPTFDVVIPILDFAQVLKTKPTSKHALKIATITLTPDVVTVSCFGTSATSPHKPGADFPDTPRIREAEDRPAERTGETALAVNMLRDLVSFLSFLGEDSLHITMSGGPAAVCYMKTDLFDLYYMPARRGKT